MAKRQQSKGITGTIRNKAHEAYESVNDNIEVVRDKTEYAIKHHPLTAVAIAAGVGVGVGFILGLKIHPSTNSRSLWHKLIDWF